MHPTPISPAKMQAGEWGGSCFSALKGRSMVPALSKGRIRVETRNMPSLEGLLPSQLEYPIAFSMGDTHSLAKRKPLLPPYMAPSLLNSENGYCPVCPIQTMPGEVLTFTVWPLRLWVQARHSSAQHFVRWENQWLSRGAH